MTGEPHPCWPVKRWLVNWVPLAHLSATGYTFVYTVLGAPSNLAIIFELKIIPEISKIYRKSYLLIRNSDENTFYMKVAQNDETNPETESVRPPHIPSIVNL